MLTSHLFPTQKKICHLLCDTKDGFMGAQTLSRKANISVLVLELLAMASRISFASSFFSQRKDYPVRL